MYFSPFIIHQANTGNIVPVTIDRASKDDLDATHDVPAWQTDWTSEYLPQPAVEKFAVKSASNDLIALAAYQIRGHSAYVYILYAESAPHSNPTMNPAEQRKYFGIRYYSATPKERYFVEEVTRVTWAHQHAQATGTKAPIRPAFAG